MQDILWPKVIFNAELSRAMREPTSLNMKKKLDVERIPDGSQAALSGLDFIWTSQEYR